MQANVGNIDRVVRLILGVILISFVFVGPQTMWGWIGVILIATALVRWCPLYRALGLSTCKIRKG